MEFIDLVSVVDLVTNKKVLCRAPGWSALSDGDIISYEVYEDDIYRYRKGKIHAILTVKNDVHNSQIEFIRSVFPSATCWPLERVISRWDKYDLSWSEDEINEQTEQTEETETEE